jgi:hypothetical protein
MKDDPTNPSNRRISIIVRNQGMDSQEEKLAGAQPGSPAAAPKPEKAAAVMLPAPAAKK